MHNPDTILIDYGMGNILSVKRALEHVGAHVIVSSNPDLISKARRLVLPGVGAFPDAMEELNHRGLASAIKEAVFGSTPLLGICLGMQVLFETSTEFIETSGLGLIPGKVTSIPRERDDGYVRKIPHIGWSALYSDCGKSWEGTILKDLAQADSVYFVHSFMAQPSYTKHRIASCNYEGISIPAVVGVENIVACQFHPEKSGEVGLRLLKNFLSEY
ncbi:imidazole glycerol phosphate synthase subunit HisH [Candidatus Methylopumilus universalis]|uniref:Imidazole glycerol phosphate synthase subunit HisH n=1 Tax=Candidatus Methylopumilus universalis TaxID=2588536 RepID=A0ABX5VWA4_9PROT|nr:imidazole glycerol phosphate synthase subunit HisH [Candidatus Methylopumilus universalis]QDC51245.1 imidazole glycerol phosphate synthase subunit HisH [Candidatus Methylopumilus universalis]QDC61383.1 imidazole glycerol phosphate synthase subunit HisH [Candidatus Methylopumilus universalis]